MNNDTPDWLPIDQCPEYTMVWASDGDAVSLGSMFCSLFFPDDGWDKIEPKFFMEFPIPDAPKAK